MKLSLSVWYEFAHCGVDVGRCSRARCELTERDGFALLTGTCSGEAACVAAPAPAALLGCLIDQQP